MGLVHRPEPTDEASRKAIDCGEQDFLCPELVSHQGRLTNLSVARSVLGCESLHCLAGLCTVSPLAQTGLASLQSRFAPHPFSFRRALAEIRL
jgi:hypothetical protein